jgi:uncharacterized protein (TIGR03083 family)
VSIDYLSVIAADSERIAELASAHPQEPVPACPDWKGFNLLIHFTEVQQFWVWVTRLGGAAPDRAERPVFDEKIDEVEAARAATADLIAAFTEAGMDAPTWVWWTTDNRDTVLGSVRRQAHEALIHRVDAEQTAGLDSVIDPELAADGIAEFLERMISDVAPSSWTAASGLIELHATDVNQRWYVRLDEAGAHLDVQPEGPTLATISGPAYDLDLTLWRRSGWNTLTFEGDLDVIEDFLTSFELN